MLCVFAHIQGDRRALRNAQAEDMFGVARDAWRVAVLPARVDVVDIFKMPVLEDASQRRAGMAVDAGFLEDLACCSELEGFIEEVPGASD